MPDFDTPVHPLDDMLMEIVKTDIKSKRIIPALIGEAGTGKSSIIEGLQKYAPDRFAVFFLQVNQMAEKGDLMVPRIMETRNDDGEVHYAQHFFPHEKLREANDYALAHPEKLVIISAEEFNRAESDVVAAVMTILTTREVGDIKFADNVRFVATGNDVGDITPLDSAKVSRFSLYKVEPTIDTFFDVVPDLNPYIKRVLEANPGHLLCKPVRGTVGVATGGNDDDDSNDNPEMDAWTEISMDSGHTQFTNPRTIHGLSDWLNNAGEAMLRQTVANSIDSIVAGNNDSRRQAVSRLSAICQAHTGPTAFTYDLVREITTDLNNTPAQTGSTAGSAAPAVWQTLMRLATPGPNRSLDALDRELASYDADTTNSVIAHCLVDRHSNTSTILDRLLGDLINVEITQAFRQALTRPIASGEMTADAANMIVDRSGSSALADAIISHAELIGSPLN